MAFQDNKNKDVSYNPFDCSMNKKSEAYSETKSAGFLKYKR